MKIWCTVLLLLAGARMAGTQDMEQYVARQMVPIAHIHPDSVDFSDLEALGRAIGDAKVVMLGEQDHGDAPAFVAKSRIVRYLHEKKGFNVLVMESDFWGLNYGWQQIPKDTNSIKTFLAENIFGCWSACTACEPLLYRYIPSTFSTEHPLQLAGMDNQVLLAYSAKYLASTLDSVMRQLDLPMVHRPDYAETVIPAVHKWYNIRKDTALFQPYHAIFSEITRQLAARLGPDHLWAMTARNLVVMAEEYSGRGDYYVRNNTRDRQMAFNLDWIKKVLYPNEKIIVWAHNYHVSKYAGHYPEDFMNEARTLGEVFTNELQWADETYILGFTSYKGTAGRLNTKPYKIDKPKKESLENWIFQTGKPYAFVDFKAFNRENPSAETPFYLSGGVKGNLYHGSHRAVWNKIFDGVFYLEEISPCVARVAK